MLLQESIKQTNSLLNKLLNRSLVKTEPDIIDDTNPHKVDTIAIKALEETEFNLFNVWFKTKEKDLAPYVMLKGDILYLNAKEITLGSGKILVY